MTAHEPSRWSEEDFEKLSWHDNHVHGLELIGEGVHGTGELRMDLDFILAWVRSEEIPGRDPVQMCGDPSQIRFRIAPALLTFHEVFFPQIVLDYRASSAAMGPFSIGRIVRRLEKRARYTASLWTIELNWPTGEIAFEATGFTQVLTGPARVVGRQLLTREERRADSRSS